MIHLRQDALVQQQLDVPGTDHQTVDGIQTFVEILDPAVGQLLFELVRKHLIDLLSDIPARARNDMHVRLLRQFL
ncbi:hypothetical protein D3C81_2049880 [compost metagenome]